MAIVKKKLSLIRFDTKNFYKKDRFKGYIRKIFFMDSGDSNKFNRLIL